MANEDSRRGIGPRPQGPYLAAAVLCERVIEGTDGSLSLIGIYDTLATAPFDPPLAEYPNAFSTVVTLVITLRAGGFTGDYPLTLELISPDGHRRKVLDFGVPLADPTGISNSILDMGVEGTEAGEHWFVLRRERKELTRIRLNVIVDRDIQPRPGGARMPAGHRRGSATDDA